MDKLDLAMEETQFQHMNGFINQELEFLLTPVNYMKLAHLNLLKETAEEEVKISNVNQKIFVKLVILSLLMEENVLPFINIQM